MIVEAICREERKDGGALRAFHPTAQEKRMKRNWMHTVMCTLTAIILSSCGNSSGGGEPDTMTFTMSSHLGTTSVSYVEGSYSTNSLGKTFLNPSLYAYVTATDETFVGLQYWDGYSVGVTRFVDINVNGNAPGVYDLDTAVLYRGQVFGQFSAAADSNFVSKSGTVTLSSVGGSGEKVTGTFDAIVTLVSDTTNTFRLSGSFSVTRRE
jgi:hypothetical protein